MWKATRQKKVSDGNDGMPNALDVERRRVAATVVQIMGRVVTAFNTTQEIKWAVNLDDSVIYE